MQSNPGRRIVRTAFTLGAVLTAVGLTLFLQKTPSAANHTRPLRAAAANIETTYDHLPLSFAEQRDQTGAGANYVARGTGLTVSLTSDGVALLLEPKRRRHSASAPTVLRMKLSAANPRARVIAEEELPGKVNYLIGNDPTRWRTNIPTYASVRYAAVYPGIDWVFYGNQQQLEYDFRVAPGADAASIGLTFEGSRRLTVTEDGELVVEAGGHDIHFKKPAAYQEQHGHRHAVPAAYTVRDAEHVRFALGEFDHDLPLVIDPVVQYSTFLGGLGNETGYAIAVDALGNGYVAGSTDAYDFPLMNPFQPQLGDGAVLFGGDAFVSKLNASGSALLYSTYLGGRNADSVLAIAVGAQANVYITGSTGSSNFPTRNAIQPTFGGGTRDAFLTELTADGTGIVFSTYLGGGNFDEGRGLALDSTGSVYVAGRTDSTDFPTANAFQSVAAGQEDAFVTKVSPLGTALVFSTYLGGTGVDGASSVAVDTAGNAYVTGNTGSYDFPTVNPLQPTMSDPGGFTEPEDAFIAKLSPTGAVAYSTYLGGSAPDFGSSIAVDESGNAYVAGATSSGNFPVANPLQASSGGGQDAFVAKLNLAGSALVYSTYFGGTLSDAALGIAVSAAGNAYVVGSTSSRDLPLASAFLPAVPHENDGFIFELNPAGSALVFSTYLGSTHATARAVAVDALGSAYITGDTSDAYFPTANPIQPNLDGPMDSFVMKIANSPNPAITAISPSWGTPGAVVHATVTGLNFVAGSTTLAVSGTGVAAGTVDVTSPTSLNATFTIDGSAALDAHSVTVTTPQGASNRATFTVFSSAPECSVSLPVTVRGTVGALDVQFGIGASQVITGGNWIIVLVTYDGQQFHFYGKPLLEGYVPELNPPFTFFGALPPGIDGAPVVGVLNGFFNPGLCGYNTAFAPAISAATRALWSSQIAADVPWISYAYRYDRTDPRPR